MSTEPAVTQPAVAVSVPLGSAASAARQVPVTPRGTGGGRGVLSERVCPISPLKPGCKDGTYGEGCQQLCDCVGNAPCDPATGRCRCPPGKTGLKCGSGERNHSLGRGKREGARGRWQEARSPVLKRMQTPSWWS